jgi:DNA processing protein
MKEERIHLALLKAERVGLQTINTLLNQFKLPSEIIKLSYKDLIQWGIAKKAAQAIVTLDIHADWIKEELEYCKKNNIAILTSYNNNIPERLKHMSDIPNLLFYKGNANLNHPRTIAIIGTRNNTEYGKNFTNKLVAEFKEYGVDVLIISGLAAGIDTIAHKAALHNNFPTIGVLGHGLDMVFPAENKKLAQQILDQNGGLLTEYLTRILPIKSNFPQRNRIVAGLADLVLVVESQEKGGAMITAQMAFQQNKEVAALPGNVLQPYSAGCNLIIKNDMAHLVENAKDIIQLMNWDVALTKRSLQKTLFVDLNDEQQNLLKHFDEKSSWHFDELLHAQQCSTAKLSSLLLELEMLDVVKSLPGKYYTR